jgi:adhesin/invasin
MVEGNNQVTAPGSSVVTKPSVKVTDTNGKPVADVRITFAVASGGGSISGETQRTNASGIATVGSWTLGSSAGTNTLTATAAGLSGSPVTFTAMGDSTIPPWDY